MIHLKQRKIFIFFAMLVVIGAASIQASKSDEPLQLTLDTALHFAIRNDPVLNIYDTSIEVINGSAEQVGLRPNPMFEIEVENFLGSGSKSGIKGMEITLGFSQLIETANKREKRIEYAQSKRDIINIDHRLRYVEIESSIRHAFVSHLIAQEKLELQRSLLKVSESSEIETAKLFSAALVPKVEVTRAILAVKQQEYVVQKAESAVSFSAIQLASIIGVDPETKLLVLGNVRVEDNLPKLSEILSLLPKTALMERYEAVSRNLQAALESEIAKATPDYEFFAGGRYFNENNGDIGFVASIEFPWPIYDKNQGNIRSSRAQLRSVELKREATRRKLVATIASLHQQLNAAYAEMKTISEKLLSVAHQTLEETDAGYKNGLYTLLNVLESRNTLFEIKSDYLDALSRYALAQAKITSITNINKSE